MSQLIGESIPEEEILEIVKEDADCRPHEKETAMNFNKDRREVHVYSGIGSIIKGLIRNDVAEVRFFSVKENGKNVYKKETEEIDLENDIIVGIHASLPIGALKIQNSTRKNDNFSTLISK